MTHIAFTQVFNRTLNTSEVIALSAQLGKSWNVSAKDSECGEGRPKPGTKPTHHCTGQATTLAAAGPSNATILQLRKFVVATSAPTLHVSATLIFLMCQISNLVTESVERRVGPWIDWIIFDSQNTHAAALARVALAYVDGWHERCHGLVNGSIPALRSFRSEAASLTAMASTANAAAAGT